MGTYTKQYLSCNSSDKETINKIWNWINTRKNSSFTEKDPIQNYCWDKWSPEDKWFPNFMTDLSKEFKDTIFLLKVAGGYSYTEYYLNGENLSEDIIFPRYYPTIKQFSEALVRHKKELSEKEIKLAEQRKQQEAIADRERLEFLKKEAAALEAKLKV
jgi:hypothetical protein